MRRERPTLRFALSFQAPLAKRIVVDTRGNRPRTLEDGEAVSPTTTIYPGARPLVLILARHMVGPALPIANDVWGAASRLPRSEFAEPQRMPCLQAPGNDG